MAVSFVAIRSALIPNRLETALSISDNCLLEWIAQGNQLAMRALFARHRVRVYRFILRITHDRTLADDAVSDVFFDVWQQADRFEARSSVSTWLLAIARNKAFAAMRCRQHAALDDETAQSVPDPADGPDLALEKKDRSNELYRCLRSLSPEHREIIDLVYYHEKPIREVAEIVSIPTATVKTRMFYARKRLAELLYAA